MRWLALLCLPDEIEFVAIKDDKVFFIATSDAVKTAEIPACQKVWKQMMARPVNKKDPRGDMTREDNAMTAYTTCFAKETPSQSRFAAAVKAQSQLDLLPLRQEPQLEHLAHPPPGPSQARRPAQPL